ncbi:MAG TPA: ribonuclease E/G [Stellaceae bacterium]|nr:ribonuclease E/G [Stellaceae bacterium]
MPGELLIAAGPGEWRAAWVEDDEAVELYVERGDTRPAGSIHLGRVVRLVPGLEAALVDIGDERPALLPLRDAPGVKPAEGARMLVQVRREAWADKAPLLTAKVSAGDHPALDDRAPQLDPPAQLFPPPGFAAALALRLPGRPQRIRADDRAILGELRAAFPGVEVTPIAALDWPLDLDAVFEAAVAPSLFLAGGGNVHIEECRTATLIDVDTGIPDARSAERAPVAVNRAAAALIGKQLRLRNIAGPIVVDFVGLDRRGAREGVRQALAAALERDPANPQLLGWTRLGHIEIVRPRRGRSLGDALFELDAGAARAKRAVTVAHEALRRLQREARADPAANWRLSVPQAVEAALRGPAARGLHALETRLGRRIAIVVASDRREGFDIAPVQAHIAGHES